MTEGWAASEVMFEPEALGRWLGQRHVTSALVVHDPVLANSTILERVCGKAARARVDVRRLPCPRGSDVEAVSQVAAALGDADVVVAIGGGTVMDRVKLAIAVEIDAVATWRRLTSPQRGGLVVLPAAKMRRRRLLLAVPTTIGTGSETSAVAIIDIDGRRRLGASAALRPDAALVEPAATETLPGELVVEGALEALTRAVGPYIADHESRPVEDALAETIAAGVARHGDAAAAARDRGEPVPAEVRLALAKWSAISQLGWHKVRRDPYGYRVWYVATELAVVAGVRKMAAQRAVLPPVLRRIAAGDRRWGSARRLARAWGIIRDALDAPLPAGHDDAPRGFDALDAPLPAGHDDAPRGFDALLTKWCGSPVKGLSDVDANEVAERCHRAWGAGMPMLQPFTIAEMADVIHEAAIGQTTIRS